MTISLPTPENNSGTNDWSDVYSNDKALKEAIEALTTEVSALSKPTIELLTATEDTSLTGSYADLKGLTCEITPTINVKLITVLSVRSEIFSEDSASAFANYTISVNASDDASFVEHSSRYGEASKVLRQTTTGIYVTTASSGTKYTIKGRGLRASGAATVKAKTGSKLFVLALPR